jgi:hypothetical protein
VDVSSCGSYQLLHQNNKHHKHELTKKHQKHVPCRLKYLAFLFVTSALTERGMVMIKESDTVKHRFNALDLMSLSKF